MTSRNTQSAMSDSPHRVTVTVTGMTCGHCTAAVERVIRAIPGVTEVDAHLPDGAVTILSCFAVEAFAIASAVESVGYEVAR